MAEQISGIQVEIGGDDAPLRKVIAGLDEAFAPLVSRFQAIGQGISGAMRDALRPAGEYVQQIGRTMTMSVTLPMAGISLAALKASADMEQARIAFTTMLGSAEAAGKVIKDLYGFAASTPFEFGEIQAAAKSLIAFGENAEEVTGTLRRIGDISAGVGAPLGEIAQVYGKARVQGRLFAEDINQLTGRGIPVIQEFARQFGVTDEEVKKLVESGAIGFGNLEQAFASLTSEGGRFFGLTQAQSKSLLGVWSTFKDAFKPLLTAIGDGIQQVFDIKGALASLSTTIEGIAEGIKSFSREHPALFKIAVVFTAMLAAMGPLLIVLGKFMVIASQIAIVTALWRGYAVLMTLFPPLAGATSAGLGLITAGLKAMALSFAIATAKIALIAAALYGLKKLFEASGADFGILKDAANDAFSGIVEAARPILDALQGVIGQVLGAIEVLWSEHGGTILKAVKWSFEAVFTVVGDVLRQVGDMIAFWLNLFSGNWAAAWDNVLLITLRVLKYVLGAVDLLLSGWEKAFAILPPAIGGGLVEGVGSARALVQASLDETLAKIDTMEAGRGAGKDYVGGFAEVVKGMFGGGTRATPPGGKPKEWAANIAAVSPMSLAGWQDRPALSTKGLHGPLTGAGDIVTGPLKELEWVPEKLKPITDGVSDLTVALAEMGAAVNDTLAEGLNRSLDIASSAIADLVTGFRSFKDVVANLGQALHALIADMVQALLKMAAMAALRAIFAGATGGISGAILTMAGGTLATPGGGANLMAASAMPAAALTAGGLNIHITGEFRKHQDYSLAEVESAIVDRLESGGGGILVDAVRRAGS